MDKESLKLARDIILKEIGNNRKINSTDKAELVINLWNFLDSEKYDNNIKVLMKNDKKKR